MVTFILVIIILLGLVFFYKFTSKQIQDEQEKYFDERFKESIYTIPNLPEIKCSFLGGEEECIDVAKLEAFKRLISENKQFYASKLEGRNITIYEVYPKSVEKWELTNFKLECKGTRVVTPVSLYFSKGDYRIGKMAVGDCR